MTFREIEAAEGVPAVRSEESPLSDWYVRVRDVSLSDFGIEDLCKSVRQCLYLKHVIPFALEALEKGPLAGEMYDGELAMSFRGVPDSFWRNSRGLAERLLRTMRQVVTLIDNDFRSDGEAIVATLERLLQTDR